MCREKILFLSVDVDDIRKEGNKNNLKPMWDNDETSWRRGTNISVRSSFVGTYARECKPNLKITQEQDDNDLLEPLIAASTIKQLLDWGRSHADTVTWSHDVEEHVRKSSNYVKSPHLVCVITNSKMKNWRVLDKCQKFIACRSECVYYAHIGRPDTFMVEKSPDTCFHQMEQSRDKRFVRLISYIRFITMNRQYCHVDNTAQHQHSRQGLFDLKDSNSTSGDICHTLIPITWTWTGVFTEQRRSRSHLSRYLSKIGKNSCDQFAGRDWRFPGVSSWDWSHT